MYEEWVNKLLHMEAHCVEAYDATHLLHRHHPSPPPNRWVDGLDGLGEPSKHHDVHFQCLSWDGTCDQHSCG